MMMTLKTGRRGVADLDTQPGKITMTAAIVKIRLRVVEVVEVKAVGEEAATVMEKVEMEEGEAVKVMEQVAVEVALVMEETLEAGTIDYTGAVREFEQVTA